MKVLFVICFVVVICMIIANIIWDIALTERERKVKGELLDLSLKWGKLRSKEAVVEKIKKLLQDKEQFLSDKLALIDKQSDTLKELETKLNEKAELLDTRAAELKDYEKALDEMKASLVADYKKAKKK